MSNLASICLAGREMVAKREQYDSHNTTEHDVGYGARYNELKKKVRCPNLEEPRQHPTRRGFKTKVDCYLSRLMKFPEEVAVAHCPHEMHLWGILEGDPDVRYMVPQSHAFYIGTSGYTADLYFEKNGRRYIAEVKSEKDFEKFEEKSYCLREFLRPTVFSFIHITNESIAEREVFARNWLRIVQTLVTSTHVRTERAAEIVMDRLHEKPLQLGDIIDMSHRVDECQMEIALYRLAHRGKIQLDLEHERLNADTAVSLCR